MKWIREFDEILSGQIALFGGKNSSLGDLRRLGRQKGFQVPDGFALSTQAFRDVVESNRLNDKIQESIQLFYSDQKSLEETGSDLRERMLGAEFPKELAEEIRTAYRALCDRLHRDEVVLVVRSSATAEDLPDASFAGLHESFLNIRGEEDLLKACKHCMASLYTNRALIYRRKKGIDEERVALSVGVQQMIPADNGASGVVFTLDTETGFPNVVLLNGSWGYGEAVVQGAVDPDQFLVFKHGLISGVKDPILERKLGAKAHKLICDEASTGFGAVSVLREEACSAEERNEFCIESSDVLDLTHWSMQIERHHGQAMDIEWVKDEADGTLYIVQARPETVHSSRRQLLRTFRFKENPGDVFLEGVSVGRSITHGRVRKVKNLSELDGLASDQILVTEMTSPDWVPAMSKVAGIITEKGGRTCHAAIVSRELGIPAIVGAEGAMERLKENEHITLSTASGEIGEIYEGWIEFEQEDTDPATFRRTSTLLMINLGSPEAAFSSWNLPVDGVGLARLEFIISEKIGLHPMAAAHPDRIAPPLLEAWIDRARPGHRTPSEFFVEALSAGIAKIAAAHYPKPVIVRTSDFKTNEYATLIGGEEFESVEANPMLGWRGASRYTSDEYRDGFELECRAIKRVREQMGLENVIVMIPFCRTPLEAKETLHLMEKFGLRRSKEGLKVYMMCEIPSNVLMLEEFDPYFDGYSIGSNDLTQLVLGVDRDSERLSKIFDEQESSVKLAIQQLIRKAKELRKPIGICGQAPSDIPGFSNFLVQEGITSISVNPDSLLFVHQQIQEAEFNR